MEARNLELTIVSAENLPDIRHIGQTRVYASVSLNNDPQTTRCSEVDTVGGTSPTWNFKTGYTMVVESGIETAGVDVVVKLMCSRTMGDRVIGEVRIPVKSLFERGLKSEKAVSYGVEGSAEGRLNILYRFGIKLVVPKGSISGKIAPKGSVAPIPGIGGAVVQAARVNLLTASLLI